MAIPTLASPTMLALQQEVATYQKQGVPADQIQQILQNKVSGGTIPLSQLYALWTHVKANAAQTQAPPSDSVAQQLAKQVLMTTARKHPMAQQGGLPPTHSGLPVGPNGPSAAPPPPQGVAGLPQGAVGQPGGYAGGGIVAFADGGAPDPTPEELQQQFADSSGGIPYLDPATAMHYRKQDWQNMFKYGTQPVSPDYPATMGPEHRWSPAAGAKMSPGADAGLGYTPSVVDPNALGAGYGASASGPRGGGLPAILAKSPNLTEVPKVLSLKENVKEMSDAAAAEGVGGAVKVYDKFLDGQQAQLQKDKDFGRKMALAQAGFAMAEKASLRGGDPGYGGGFMGALAAGGSEAAKGLIANKDKAQAAQQKLAQLRFESAHAAEQDKLGIVKDAMTATRAQAQEYAAAVRANAAIMDSHEGHIVQYLDAMESAKLRGEMYSQKNDPYLLAYKKDFHDNPDNPKARQRLQDYVQLTSGTYQTALEKAASAQGLAQLKYANDPVLQMMIQRGMLGDQGGQGGASAFDPSAFTVTPMGK